MKDEKTYLMNEVLPENPSPEELESKKEAFRKQKRNADQNAFRKMRKRLELVMTFMAYNFLVGEARRHGMKVGPYILAAALAYSKKIFVRLPGNKVQELRLMIRRVGNNINQIVRYCHHRKGVSMEAIRQMQKQIDWVEEQVRARLEEPPELRDLILQELRNNPGFEGELLEMLHDIKPHHNDRQNHPMEDQRLEAPG